MRWILSFNCLWMSWIQFVTYYFFLLNFLLTLQFLKLPVQTFDFSLTRELENLGKRGYQLLLDCLVLLSEDLLRPLQNSILSVQLRKFLTFFLVSSSFAAEFCHQAFQLWNTKKQRWTQDWTGSFHKRRFKNLIIYPKNKLKPSLLHTGMLFNYFMSQKHNIKKTESLFYNDIV